MTTNPLPPRLAKTGRLIPPGLDEAAIALLVDLFYARARADAVIGPIFNRVIAPDEWPEHLRLIADFWSAMLLGTGRYGGRPMPKHLAIHDLGDAHFARWLMLFRQTAEEVCSAEIAALFVDRAERIAQSFRLGLHQYRGGTGDPPEIMRAAPAPWSPEP